MIELGAFSGWATIAALVAISFVSYVAGFAFRKWPEKVREYVEAVDGSLCLLTEDAHRAMIDLCGRVLIGLSITALAVAGLV